MKHLPTSEKCIKKFSKTEVAHEKKKRTNLETSCSFVNRFSFIVTLYCKDWLLEVYVHFRWTIEGPDSSYSYFPIHISSNVESDARMDPPTQTLYCRPGGAMIVRLS